jgi:hypothetical protein
MENKGTPDLPICGVRTDLAWTVGMLYFQNDRVVVLLNHLVKGIDLGPLKPLCKKYREHETDMFIFPKAAVNEIQILSTTPI